MPGWLLCQPADGRVVVPESTTDGDTEAAAEGSIRCGFWARGLASLLARMMSEARRAPATVRSCRSGVFRRQWFEGPMQKWAVKWG